MSLDIPLIESLSFNAWPALETMIYDGWVLRFARGYTKRANSVNPLYPGKEAIASKLRYCEVEYAREGLPLILKLTDLPHALEIDRMAESRGFTKLDETSVQTRNLDGQAPRVHGQIGPPGTVEWDNSFAPGWLANYLALSPHRHYSPTERAAMEGLLQAIRPPHWFYAFYLADESAPLFSDLGKRQFVGAGLGVLQDGYYGIFDIVVHPDFRRRGIASRVVEGMLAHARKVGGHTAYLQVVKANQPAVSLYRRLGFQELYRYWYRKAPPSK